MQRTMPFILTGLLAGVPAFAQDGIDFDRHDRDNDGYLSESEWNAIGNAGVDFDMVDTNRDGRLDKAEVKAGMSQQEDRPVSQQSAPQPSQPETLSVSGGEGQPRNVGMYDANEDGRVSRGEARKDGELMTWFVIWDTDRDGYLNQDELAEGPRQDDSQQPGNTERDRRQQDSGADDERTRDQDT